MGKRRPPLIEAEYLYSLAPYGSKLLIAVSAGIDSTVCAHYLAGMQKAMKIQIALAYIHHGLRPQADEESLFVNFLAGNLHVPFYTAKIEPGKDSGVQNRARKMRYKALEKIADENRFDLIVTAHNRDDQAETVLFRGLRGTGVTGLSGILPKAGRVIRPLLHVSRKRIEGYAKESDLQYLEDLSNLSDNYTRNRLRHHSIPALNELMGHDVRPLLARLAKISLWEREILEDVARQDYAKVRISSGELKNGIEKFQWISGEPAENLFAVLKIKNLTNLPAGRRMGVYRHILKEAKGDLLGISTTHLEAIDKLIQSDNPSAFTILPGEIKIGLEYEKLNFYKGPFEDVLPEKVEIDDFGTSVFNGYRIIVKSATPDFRTQDRQSLDVLFNESFLEFPLIVRTWEKGDKIHLAGQEGTKKLSDIFVDLKIPKALRTKIPIFSDSKGVLWVPGIGMDNRGLILPKTEKAVRMCLEKIRK